MSLLLKHVFPSPIPYDQLVRRTNSSYTFHFDTRSDATGWFGRGNGKSLSRYDKLAGRYRGHESNISMGATSTELRVSFC